MLTELRERLGTARAHPNGTAVGLVMECFGVAQKLMQGLIDLDALGSSKLVLLGGVQVHTPHPQTGLFLPVACSLHAADLEPESLMEWLQEDDLCGDSPGTAASCGPGGPRAGPPAQGTAWDAFTPGAAGPHVGSWGCS